MEEVPLSFLQNKLLACLLKRQCHEIFNKLLNFAKFFPKILCPRSCWLVVRYLEAFPHLVVAWAVTDGIFFR